MLRRLFPRLCAAGQVERMIEDVDAIVVGGGPAGLSSAIRLKQLASAAGNNDFRVILVEKGPSIGAHILSGACIEPKTLDEFLPEWRQETELVKSPVTSDHFYYLTKTGKIPSPFLPPSLHNHGNYLGSLGALTAWMGQKAEELGVEIFAGFAAAEPYYSEDGSALCGVQLHDAGINKKGGMGPQFEPGMILRAKQTIVAEGCRGSLTKRLETKFDLRSSPQTYGLGVKEIWEVPSHTFKPGYIMHTMGWPLTAKGHHNTYGGSWLYHYGKNLMSVGFVVGLDYSNPFIRPYMEFQKWKTHPFIASAFEGAQPLWYGARTLVEGGLASQPKLAFPGGVLVGDCAGFLNLPKIKGNHTAMKSGTIAAEALWEQCYVKGAPEFGQVATRYPDLYKSSWLHKELYTIRNCRQHFAMNVGLGVVYTGLTVMLTQGAEPWTLSHHQPDHLCLKPAAEVTPIEYPKPDGKLTFDLLTNHSRSGTSHNADQPVHLRLNKPEAAVEYNWRVFAGPESRYCPAGVYEFVDDASSNPSQKKLLINAQNCLHCKACDIKDPTQNIQWFTPEGGGGPDYNAQL